MRTQRPVDGRPSTSSKTSVLRDLRSLLPLKIINFPNKLQYILQFASLQSRDVVRSSGTSVVLTRNHSMLRDQTPVLMHLLKLTVQDLHDPVCRCQSFKAASESTSSPRTELPQRSATSLQVVARMIFSTVRSFLTKFASISISVSRGRERFI